jgi:hypothetical protein
LAEAPISTRGQVKGLPFLRADELLSVGPRQTEAGWHRSADGLPAT